MLDQGVDLARSAARVVAEITKGPVSRTEEILGGVMTYKFVVWSAHGKAYLVRFYPPTRPNVVCFEPDLIRRCAENGIDVPEVVADSRTGPRAELQYIVYERIEGTSLGDRFGALPAASKRELGCRLVQILSTFAQMRFDGVGEPLDAWRAKDDSWRVFVRRSFLEGLQSVKVSCLVEEELIAGLCELEEHVDRYVAAEAGSLVWVDICLENIIADSGGSLVGLIDFESVLVGDPLMALGSCYARYGDHEFFHSIISSLPVPLNEPQWSQVNFYAVLRTLRVAKYAGQPLPTGRSREPLGSIFPGFVLALQRLSKTHPR